HLLHSKRSFYLLSHAFGSRSSSLFGFAGLVGLLTIYPAEVSGLPRLTYQLCMAALLVSCVYRDDHVLRSVPANASCASSAHHACSRGSMALGRQRAPSVQLNAASFLPVRGLIALK